jgi:hypothetical protein
MPTPSEQPIRIRKTDDLCPPGGEPWNPDHCTTAADMRTRISALERELEAIKSAFVIDDLGKPDFGGHRVAHKKLIAAAEVMDKYKHTVTLKIVGAIAAFLIGVIFSGGIPLIPLK